MADVIEIVTNPTTLEIIESGATTVLEIQSSSVQILEVNAQGPAGPPGLNSSQSAVVGEIPSGIINGSNAAFTSAYDFVPESVQVFANGLFQKRIDDFNTSGTRNVQLTFSPNTGEIILLNYVRS